MYVCVYMCVCTCMHVYICVCACVDVSMYIHVCVCINANLFVNHLLLTSLDFAFDITKINYILQNELP
jgi:hypothetical protein